MQQSLAPESHSPRTPEYPPEATAYDKDTYGPLLDPTEILAWARAGSQQPNVEPSERLEPGSTVAVDHNHCG